MLAYCLLIERFDCFQFLPWSETWGDAIRYELRYRFVDVDGKCYFVGYHNQKVSMVPPEDRCKEHIWVPDQRSKYKPCHTLLVLTNPLFESVSRVLKDALVS